MIALDTNVLVRFLAQDDEPQFRAALRLLNRKGGIFHLSDLVLAEADWVLRSLYGWRAQEVAEAVARLTTIHNLVFEDAGGPGRCREFMEAAPARGCADTTGRPVR